MMVRWGRGVHVCVMGSREMDTAGHPPSESEDGWGREKDQGHHFPSEQVECKCTWATLGWSEVCPHKSLASPEGTDWLSFPFWRWSLWQQYEFIPKSLHSASMTTPFSYSTCTRVLVGTRLC